MKDAAGPSGRESFHGTFFHGKSNGIDTYELLVGEDLSQVLVNANAPAFPNFPYREVGDAAYDAAIEVLASALLEQDEEEDER